MDISHQPGCDERHTLRQRCNGAPRVDETTNPSDTPGSSRLGGSGPIHRSTLSRETARLAVFLELAPAIAIVLAAMVLLAFVVVGQLASAELASGPAVAGLAVFFVLSCFGGVGWMVADRDAVGWLLEAIRIIAMFAAFTAVLVALFSSSPAIAAAITATTFVLSFLGSVASAVALARSERLRMH